MLTLRMESGDEAVLGHRWPHTLLIASSSDPYHLINTAVAQAAQISGTAKPLHQKRLPPSLDVFGWCSWDAFYSSVSAQGLVDAVVSLTTGGTPPKLVIIDDGWQVTDLDSKFKGWQDITTTLIAQATGKDVETAHSNAHLNRERYIEGESEMISAVLRDVPAGSATGVLLQEIKAADDELLENIDYLTLAQQHDASMDEHDGASFRRSSKESPSVPPASGASPSSSSIPSDASSGSTTRKTTTGGRRRPRLYPIVEITWALLQYIAGLIVGAFQAIIILFYQWVVDPAADGTWPVKFFTFMAQGPLRGHMLQFYADQTNFTRRLIDVRANSKFHSPESTAEAIHSGKDADLGSVVAHLRSAHDVRYVYCWHGLNAYWSGVNPDAPAMRRYKARMVYAKPPLSLREIEPSMQWNPSVLAGVGAISDPGPLYHDMHSYLAAAGITGVKVDCQAGVGMVGSVTGGGPSVAARYHAALEDSVARHFPGNDAINCMCHSTENVYRWRDTAVARASDDYYPSDTASHMPHIAACAFNGTFLSALALPDWDMFHSSAPASPLTPALHAAARAVSGGPVYVSDAPGCHGFDILRQLVLPDGTVLRALLPGRPTRDSLFLDIMRDGASLLKVWNVNAFTGVVGVFNLQGSSWDRTRRRFAVHSTAEIKLKTMVRVRDVERYRDFDFISQHTSAENGRHVAATASDSTESDESEATHFDHQSPATHKVTGSNGRIEEMEEDSGYASDTSNVEGYHHHDDLMPTHGCDFVAYVNKTDRMHRIQFNDGVEVSLERSHAAIVTFAPVVQHRGIDFAPIGLRNMLNGGGAITCIRAQRQLDEGDGNESLLSQLMVGVRGRGTLLALCSVKPVQCLVDGYAVSFTWVDERLEVEVPQIGKHSEQRVLIHF